VDKTFTFINQQLVTSLVSDCFCLCGKFCCSAVATDHCESSNTSQVLSFRWWNHARMRSYWSPGARVSLLMTFCYSLSTPDVVMNYCDHSARQYVCLSAPMFLQSCVQRNTNSL